MDKQLDDICIGMVGLGYVGLPAAITFAALYDVIGYDIEKQKVDALRKGREGTGEVTEEELANTTCRFTSDPRDLNICDVIIVAVPTPIDKNNRPDLSYLKKATETVASHLKDGAIVVYESTVYPGATEEICIPILERITGFSVGEGFSIGYSPERINPGDKKNTLKTIGKLVAGYDQVTLDTLVALYGSVLEAPVYPVASIKVAEAAKVVENTQRDVNIAYMNELAQLFDKMDMDIFEVLAAAGTKWNFIPFEPGLVGGHCISVDPYYLIEKAKNVGFTPALISTARNQNAKMGKYIVDKITKIANELNLTNRELKVNVLGVTFKENVPDLRNSMAIDIVKLLKEKGIHVHMADPVANEEEVEEMCGEAISAYHELPSADIVLLLVPHNQFTKQPEEYYHAMLKSEQSVIIDLKNRLSIDQWNKKVNYWTL
ncbi:nucleotide sugar dehydrogenase [Paraliobacillus ryukyuensis]|uniref:nucleotide sugar dehydrogenase n=1 Tax=Paraliobacillus ryukyuensis TaxID=200904 RepID=UPI0009A83004|nr:nucleotide sugar dehydrogenase [Paraliobacillus ryukyuensis]